MFAELFVSEGEMQLSQRNRVEMSEYEGAKSVLQSTYGSEPKTEDIYQTLQSPTTNVVLKKEQQLPVRVGNPYFLSVYLVMMLLLVVILVIVGVHYYQFTESVAHVNTDLRQGDEVWLQNQRIFYLFWEGEGDCSSAQHFCSQRNARLATLDLDNKDWILSKARGQRLWLVDGLPIQEEMSGNEFRDDTDDMDDTFNIKSYGPTVDCVLLNRGPSPHGSESSQGWVCQINAFSTGCIW